MNFEKSVDIWTVKTVKYSVVSTKDMNTMILSQFSILNMNDSKKLFKILLNKSEIRKAQR